MPDISKPDVILVSETGLGRYQVEARGGQNAILVDEPASVGGLGSGLNPYDLLCAALGACKTMTMRLYANQKGWKVGRIQVSVSHARLKLQMRDEFNVEILIEGELEEAQRQRLAEIASRCPVHLTLAAGAEVRSVLAGQAVAHTTPSSSDNHVQCMGEACQG